MAKPLGNFVSYKMPSDIATKLKNLAARLLAYEGLPPYGEAAVVRVCEKLRGALSQLTGVGGFRSLLSRALALAGTEMPWLRGVHIKSDGSLEGVEALQAKLDKETISSGEVALVARLLGLLVTFIGPSLTKRLVEDIWPKMDGLNLETENGDEEK